MNDLSCDYWYILVEDIEPLFALKEGYAPKTWHPTSLPSRAVGNQKTMSPKADST